MKIHINIDEIVLHGFNYYHDSRQLAMSIEHELRSLVKENGLPKEFHKNNDISIIDSGSSFVAQSTNNNSTKIVGREIARSIYRGWSKDTILSE
jgi:hypothetical protein